MEVSSIYLPPSGNIYVLLSSVTHRTVGVRTAAQRLHNYVHLEISQCLRRAWGRKIAPPSPPPKTTRGTARRMFLVGRADAETNVPAAADRFPATRRTSGKEVSTPSLPYLAVVLVVEVDQEKQPIGCRPDRCASLTSGLGEPDPQRAGRDSNQTRDRVRRRGTCPLPAATVLAAAKMFAAVALLQQ